VSRVRARDRLTRLAAMPGTNRLLGLLAMVATVGALSGCGSNDINGKIPQSDADELNGALEAVRSDIAARDCEAASSEADAFINGVNQLPATAGEDLKKALRDAGGNLQQLVADQCTTTQTTPTTSTQSTRSSSTTSTRPTTSSSTSSTTSTQTTTTTTTTSSTETAPPESGGGGGGGGDGGDGGTGGGSGGTGG